MRKIKFLLKLFTFCLISFIIVISAFYAYAYITPKFDLNTKNQVLLYDVNNELVFNHDESWIKIADISEHIKNATVSVEDKNFYAHKGFDYPRIVKAMLINIKNQSLEQGASTISMQYIKNLFLEFDKKWSRKIEEAFLTFELEVHYSKDEILEGYLNTIDYGAGNYGINDACKYYFNKHPKDLTLAEATLVVGIPRNPSAYNPITNFETAKKRQKTVLNTMVKNDYITQKEADKIYETEIEFYGKRDKEELSSLYYYRDAVMNELSTIAQVPKSLLNVGGLKIYTELDKDSQKSLEESINKEMNKQDELQVAGLIVNPKTGGVNALIGGRDYMTSQFNRVTQARRQVGSTIKPFLYYAALENGFTPSSVFISEKTTFNLGNEKTYSPKNAGDIYANKEISLASAIAYSDNVFALKTHLFLGEETLVNTALKAGIKTKLDPNASLALGTNEISILDYSNGFTTLANEGRSNSTHLIRKVTDMEGNVLYEYKEDEVLALNQKYVYILNNMLANTYSYQMVDYTSPTMISVNDILKNKYAVKSGSTSSDYWVVGYDKNNVVMVWTGYDDNRDVKSSQSRIGKRIWANTITKITDKEENNWYDIPSGVVGALIEPVSGEIASSGKSILAFYSKGTEPGISFNNFDDLVTKKED